MGGGGGEGDDIVSVRRSIVEYNRVPENRSQKTRSIAKLNNRKPRKRIPTRMVETKTLIYKIE